MKIGNRWRWTSIWKQNGNGTLKEGRAQSTSGPFNFVYDGVQLEAGQLYAVEPDGSIWHWANTEYYPGENIEIDAVGWEKIAMPVLGRIIGL